MILTYNRLTEIVDEGVLMPVPHAHINASSIDVRLGRYAWVEDERGGIVDLAEKQFPAMHRIDLVAEPLVLRPGEWCLAQTVEMFNLPNTISAEFRLKSSAARAGLDQALAVWCDPGFHGSVLTLELRNNLQHHDLLLRYRTKIGQVVFHQGEAVPPMASYAVRGQYNNDAQATQSKGVR